MSEELESAKLVRNREWVSDMYVVLSMLSGLNLFFYNNNNNFLIDVPFKVILLGLKILGAAIDILLAAFRGVSL
jgi:hypothetical protein